MKATAVVLSAKPVHRVIPGVHVINFVSRFATTGGHMRSWLAALDRVNTEWCFFLDSDDELPGGFTQILERCMATELDLSYTNELITSEDASVRVIRQGKVYSEDNFLRDPLLLHHLVVMRTSAARFAAATIPRGEYAIEPMLFFQMAKLGGGANFVDEVGYIWHRRATGRSQKPECLSARLNSRRWCHQNQGAV